MTALRDALMWLLSQYGVVPRTPARRPPWVQIGPVG